MSRLNILKLPRAVVSHRPAPEPIRVVSPETLCRTCVFSQIVVGHRDERLLVLCGFDGQLRSLPFAVVSCTDYRERGKRHATRIGFGAGV
jgi:hypothetical protein